MSKPDGVYIPKDIANMMIDIIIFSLLEVSPSFWADNEDLLQEAVHKIFVDFCDEQGIDGVVCDEPL